MNIREWAVYAIDAVAAWQATWGAYQPHPSLAVDPDALARGLAELSERLTGNYPFFHPRYAGQMIKPPHPVAVVGYLAAMLINPNNHALDGGPPTAVMEREAVDALARMFGFEVHLGHLTSSGTIANLEALFVARETHPGRPIAIGAESHYTHARMSHLLGVPTRSVPADAHGRMDLDALAELLARGEVGTVVATLGTTSLGAIDPLDAIVALARSHGARVHVDAAYGGFYALLAGAGPDGLDPAPWRALAECDSVAIDPHKHGLQPYGCGAVLFRDPAVGRFYRHDSPYTYFTSGELHLGEISLECSRAGAAAAALWLTQRLLPLTADGLGAVLAANLRAARAWARLIETTEALTLYQPPQLDIVTCFPTLDRPAMTAIDAASAAILHTGMSEADPVFLSTLRATREALRQRHPSVVDDAASARILRSALMKPESETWVTWLHDRVAGLAAQARAGALSLPQP
ncbi:pyridoxal phosphate-dependent decarboxylase family protein [Nannocystis radixulma]|uniref:Aminotransferase class I/II-fold pyridoxal phosphate-dependent enzyme n=1 Tax=Nannocystis radixulma TaxID=2995305 RepID=A0ABT5BG90_9BACT|nr:aminotransferase class I/II-fold pyridoxal phosphate-dependent enzyme [Nannocystis radixulma]MDC0672458.1 aminotransferase class I/II-fold pyridoxal phosphate-dependent enzyme [Nannocystis radixulma]